MSFIDKAATKPNQKLSSCAVRTVLDNLVPEEADALRAMLAEPAKYRTHASLMNDLADEGYPMSDNTIGKHRRHECSCRLLVNA